MVKILDEKRSVSQPPGIPLKCQPSASWEKVNQSGNALPSDRPEIYCRGSPFGLSKVSFGRKNSKGSPTLAVREGRRCLSSGGRLKLMDRVMGVLALYAASVCARTVSETCPVTLGTPNKCNF